MLTFRHFIFATVLVSVLWLAQGANGWTMDPNPEHDDTTEWRNRDYPDCDHVKDCKQKIRTNYITDDVCGQAAMCYWEVWNYRRKKFDADVIRSGGAHNISKDEFYDGECDKYLVQKYACLIGYPKPQHPNENCYPDLVKCDSILSKMLYEDCEPLRKERGLPKPEEVDWHIRTDNMNFDLSDDKDHQFEALPDPENVTENNFYTISCPIIFRYPYFTIDLLLKWYDPNYDYDETMAMKGVASLLPKYVRLGMNTERILNFEALSLKENLINWCSIPRNYICIEREEDPMGESCHWDTLESYRQKCEPDVPPPREKPETPEPIYKREE